MKIAVIGAGAMGCLYGAAFHRSGAHVTLVDVNPAHLDAISTHGLILDRRGGREVLPIKACRPEELTEEQDLLLVFTKTFQTDAALKAVAPAIGPSTQFLSLQNGLGNAERLAAHASESRVLVGVSTLPADLVGPGHVRSHGDGGTKLYCAFSSGDADFAQAVAAMLTSGDLAASVDPQIHSAVWFKAIFNAAMNPLCALTLRTPGFLGSHAESRAMIRAVVDEGFETAKASGITLDHEAILALTEVSMTDHADHEASMLQDRKAGRRTEIDAINGAIVAVARARGLSVPVTETLWRLVTLEDAKLAAS